jgi:hypothetical protein
MASQSPNPESYYGYLFKKDKTPTELLDALLRAIALYIVSNHPVSIRFFSAHDL